ncbi:MAG TPA: ABC transporter permease [Blastocatellia bacterium]
MSPLSRCKRLFRRPHLRLIALVGVIVALRLRANWRREWEAELRHREVMLAEWDRLDWRSKLDLLRRSTSAFWDALWLQPKRLEDEMFQDLRFGLRMLLKNPGFTLIAALTLSLGIGASAAIFSAVNPILFESLPFPHADRIAMVWDRGSEGSRLDITFGTYRELAQRSRSFESLAVMKAWQPTLTGRAEPERLDGQRVSAGYFRVLGAPPAIGRDFDSSDDRPNGPQVAILSDGLWRRRFGGDAAIIGRQVTLDDASFTVIGVASSAFENVLSPSADVWTLLQYDPSLPLQGREWGRHLRMAGRLRQGVGMDQARQELDTIAIAPASEFPRAPWAPLRQGFMTRSLQDDVTEGVRPALLAVLGAVLLLLAIACVNVTNLLLARGSQRRGEFAMRAALGAPRTRLIRQLLTESLLLAVFSGALGMVVAEFGVRALTPLSPPGLPRVGAIRVDGAVFAFGMGVATLVGVAVGLIPALQASRSDLRIGLQQSSRSVSHSTRRALVVAEVTLALTLLIGAGLLLRSQFRLFSISSGFDSSSMLTMQVQTSGRRFDKDATDRFFAQALEAVRQTPGVTAAAFTSQLPLSGDYDMYGVSLEPSADIRHEGGNPAFRYAVSPSYFEAMVIPLRSGRLFDARDGADAPPSVVISESLAKSKFQGQDPLGKRLRVGGDDGPWRVVVGVVGDVKQMSLAAPQSDAVYTTAEQYSFIESSRSLVVRARGDAAALAPAIRKAIWSVNKDQPISRVATMDELLAATAAERRFALILFEAFGLVALALACAGIYGALSGSVAERTREIGVRMALGAERRDVLGMILRQGLKLTLIGVGIGLVAAWTATRMLAKLLYGVGATDPLTFGGVALLLTVVALIACYLPARRATKVDPLVALRQE